MSNYNIIMSTDEETVVSQYSPGKRRSDAYQSEAELERHFIEMLCEQSYEYVPLHREEDLISNLRKQLERLNEIRFSDKEWDRFFLEKIANPNETVADKTCKIQEDNVQNLKRDDGSTKNITLIDKKDIHNNCLQVINQYEENGGTHKTRYDVTILVNGLPLIHVELKRRGVPLKEAFNQINRYHRDSFWAGSGLYEYVQIFVISNGTATKYYSNTTRRRHVDETGTPGVFGGNTTKGRRTSNSFEFTSFWADGKNRLIPDLVDFTRTFFARHTILNILTRYCVFTSEKSLLVMRPYQIVATERILNRVVLATNYKKMGTLDAGGYIWHTTGSGKTLTSFKTAQLIAELTEVEKVLFVVDRRDLDYQTVREYDRFEKGAANGSENTAVLQRQLEDRDEKGKHHSYKILVTTIQKLARFVSRNRTHPIYDRHVVIVFDECHRSQFGNMRNDIVKRFKKYHIFGFTGTPIFSKNAGTGGKFNLCTTEQAFGEKLHSYTIVDAINDGNVLPFRVEYHNTIRQKDDRKDELVPAIKAEEALGSRERIGNVVKYILDHFDQKTVRNQNYELGKKRVRGFNSMFAVSSVATCKKYYSEFKRQLKARNSDLVVATIFSYSPNEDDTTAEGILEDESLNTDDLDLNSRDFLENAIQDYNRTFKSNFSASGDGFQKYYEDLSKRVKAKEVDLLIVVGIFLTGFDAPSLNTLWVDKNLRLHGLIQAFSRTNRILNSVKTFGNIVCFRDLSKNVDEAIALFGNKDAGGIVLLKSYADYYYGYTDEKGRERRGYEQCVKEFSRMFPIDEPIVGEQNEREFVSAFGNILRLKNILSAFDDFKGNEILSERDIQDYTGKYHDLHEKFRSRREKGESILDDVVFEMELVKQVEVNIDYILEQVKELGGSLGKDKEIRLSIEKAINSSLQLRSKKELIENFLNRINVDECNIDECWRNFVRDSREQEVKSVITEERLKETETRVFLDNAFRDGILKTTGTGISSLLPPMSRFGISGNSGARDKKKQAVTIKLESIFEKYCGVINVDEKLFSGAQDSAKDILFPRRQDESSRLSIAAETPTPYGEKRKNRRSRDK